jgi:hypothetical protein
MNTTHMHAIAWCPTRSSSITTGLPTFLAAAGDPNIIEKLKKGLEAGEETYKVQSTATTCCRNWAAE